MVEIKLNTLNLQDYKSLRKSVGWKELSDKQMTKALRNSIVTFCAYEDEKPIGMGRIVGDGAVICYIQELIVCPEYQGKGVGDALMRRLIGYVESLRIENTELMLCLMCAKGREPFYERYGFIGRPTDSLGPGMIMYLNDREK